MQMKLPDNITRVQKAAWQLLSAVEYLHGTQGVIVHRDIKPANVLLSGDG